MTEPSLIEQAIIEHWGERCPEYEAGCGACEAWKEYDAMTRQNQSPVVTDEELGKMIDYVGAGGGIDGPGAYAALKELRDRRLEAARRSETTYPVADGVEVVGYLDPDGDFDRQNYSVNHEPLIRLTDHQQTVDGLRADANALRDLSQSILQSTTLADFMAVRKTVEAIAALSSNGGKV